LAYARVYALTWRGDADVPLQNPLQFAANTPYSIAVFSPDIAELL
jgi:hypothetical protein